MFAGIDLASMIARSTASGWLLCVIGITGLFGIWRLYVLARPRMLELEIGQNTGLRKEFIEEMQALREEVKGLRLENGELRHEIRELHQIIDGMRREQLQAGASEHAVLARHLPLTPAMSRALDSLDQVKGTGES